MAIDSFEWSWGSEYKRAQLLRDALDDANAQRARTSRRLNSRLAELEGTLQSKLDALSSAFDAFVELADVREQLHELPDWSHTRRAVQASLTSLMDGERPAPLDPAEHDHWLADAMNAVVALVGGEDASVYEQRALQKSDQAPLFVVTTLVALDAGDRAQGRVASVFEGVTDLDEDHLVLLRAAVAGLVPVGDLAAIGEQLAPSLDEPEAWRSWLGIREATSVEPEVIEDFLTDGRPRAKSTYRTLRNDPGWDYEQVAEQLIRRAGVLARSGSKDEALLRTRASHLKQRIEDPTGSHPSGPQRVSTISAVQEILTHPDTPEGARQAVIGWLHRPLAGIVRGWRELGPGEPPSKKYTHRWGRQDRRVHVDVTTEGPDQMELRGAERQIQAAQPDKGNANAFLGGAAVAAVAGILVLFAGSAWMVAAVLLIIVAVVLAVLGLTRKWSARTLETEKSDAVRELREGVKQATQELQAEDAERLEQARQTDETLAELLSRLG